MLSPDLTDGTRSEPPVFHSWEHGSPSSHPVALTVLCQLYVSIVTPAQLLPSIKSSRSAPFGIVDDLLLFWIVNSIPWRELGKCSQLGDLGFHPCKVSCLPPLGPQEQVPCSIFLLSPVLGTWWMSE